MFDSLESVNISLSVFTGQQCFKHLMLAGHTVFVHSLTNCICSSFSGFVFLRLICPAILNPRMFNIIAGEHRFKKNQINKYHSLLGNMLLNVFYATIFTDPPSSAAGRTLTLVAKSVQNLANLVEFGAKVRIWTGQCTDICTEAIHHKYVSSTVSYDQDWFNFFFSVLKQEPYMEGVNPFIKNNKHRMIMFLDELGVSQTAFAFWS